MTSAPESPTPAAAPRADPFLYYLPTASTLRLWLPRSWASAGIFLLTALVVVWPVLIAALAADIVYTGCFWDCSAKDPNHLGGVLIGLIGVAFAALPLVAVRYYQGARPGYPAVRLAFVVLLLAVVWLTGTELGIDWFAWI